MTPGLRKFALIAHIVFSVGWIGAIVPYLALAITGLATPNRQTAHTAYLSMEMIGWFVIVPFSLAALLSGLVQALGTSWGLLRYWWVLAKLFLTTLATVILLQHMQDVSRASRIDNGDIVHAGGGMLLLVAITMISVFKPWGLTGYRERKTSQTDSFPLPEQAVMPSREAALVTGGMNWGRIVGFHAIGIAALLIVILHVTGGHSHFHH